MQLIQLLLTDADILIFGHFVALHQLVIVHVPLANRAKALLLDAAATGVVQLIEVDILFINGGIDSHRNGDQAEGNVSGLELACHRPSERQEDHILSKRPVTGNGKNGWRKDS